MWEIALRGCEPVSQFGIYMHMTGCDSVSPADGGVSGAVYLKEFVGDA